MLSGKEFTISKKAQPMIVIENHPTINDLRKAIAQIPSYPVSAGHVIEIAQNNHASQEVMEFYKSFPGDQVFEDADDLISRTEQLEIMHNQEMPDEQQVASDEY